MRRIAAAVVIALATLAPLTAAAQNAPAATVINSNTRAYAGVDGKKAMKAVLATMQAEGYMVRNANTELGFINAAKDVDVEDLGEAVLSILVFEEFADWDKHMTLELTAQVVEAGSGVRVQLNAQGKVTTASGAPADAGKITDEGFFREFFDRLTGNLAM